jgi:ribonuclease P protein component
MPVSTDIPSPDREPVGDAADPSDGHGTHSASPALPGFIPPAAAGSGSEAPAGAAPQAPRLPASGERFPPADRLLRRSEFVRVQQQGRRVHTSHFIVLILPGRTDHTRLGVTVGRRVGGAVQRNRIKRLVREVFRRNRALFPSACDVVLVARPGADSLDYGSVQSELERAQSAIERARKQLSAEAVSRP